jgi:hypothetical protein
MSAISHASAASTAQQIYQAQQASAQQKPAQTQPVQDTVQLSKAALQALGGGAGDVDHDGDSH